MRRRPLWFRRSRFLALVDVACIVLGTLAALAWVWALARSH